MRLLPSRKHWPLERFMRWVPRGATSTRQDRCYGACATPRFRRAHRRKWPVDCRRVRLMEVQCNVLTRCCSCHSAPPPCVAGSNGLDPFARRLQRDQHAVLAALEQPWSLPQLPFPYALHASPERITNVRKNPNNSSNYTPREICTGILPRPVCKRIVFSDSILIV